MKTKLTRKFWCALTIFSLVGQIAWVVENMYLNVFIYNMFRATPDDIALMVMASAIAATLTTVFIGALSDKIGKRKLFICGGYILWGISILGFVLVRADVIGAIVPTTVSVATVGVSLVIILDCLMTFFGSSANDAAFNAWLTDSTDSTNRGAAEGINAMMPLVAILAVFGGFMAFKLDRAESWSTIFAIIGAVVILVGIIGIFVIEEKPIPKSEEHYIKNVVHGFLPSTVKKNASLYFYLLCFIIFNISIQIFMPYLIIYYEKSLQMSDYVLIMAPAIIVASVVTAFWGKVYDKQGFGLSSAISLIWLCAGYVMLFFFRSVIPVFIGSLLMMSGYLSGMAVFGAKIRDLIPRGAAGRFQGVRIFSQVLVPGIVGPFIGKTVLADAELIQNNDGTTSFLPNEKIFLAALVAILVMVVFIAVTSKFINKPRLDKGLKTPFEEDTDSSWESEYPRPQMKRDSYLSLCGEWQLSIKKKGRTKEIGNIKVPYPPESRISGIERALRAGESYLYERNFSIERKGAERVIIHFGAVDQRARVYVNGQLAGEHVGGYLPFSLDITDKIQNGENKLAVEVEDALDTELAYGKQRKKRGGMWYTPISGIWQPVWIESVPENYIREIKITPSLEGALIECVGGGDEKTLILHLEDGDREHVFRGDAITLDLKNGRLWTPDDPYLYRFTLTDGKDRISSYFALRTVSAEQRGERSYICLNGKPIFCHGLLDQGYFSDGIYTPATPRGFLSDILTMKSLGFNMLRKHIKIEPELFYYYCDKHGMLVFQDMVNSGKYSWLIDTALPTLGKRKGITHKASARRAQSFESDSRETQRLLYNHPSVIYYTIFNEGWGQYDADRIYNELKAEDPTRIYDATSGWFAENDSDVVSDHIYFKRLDMTPRSDRPLVLSEFGGYSRKIEGHSYNLDKTYGYRFFSNDEAFEEAFEKLYVDEVLPLISEKGLCATVMTQVSDVEDETNGLLTYDRQVLKVDKARMSALSSKLYSAFEDSLK